RRRLPAWSGGLGRRNRRDAGRHRRHDHGQVRRLRAGQAGHLHPDLRGGGLGLSGGLAGGPHHLAQIRTGQGLRTRRREGRSSEGAGAPLQFHREGFMNIHRRALLRVGAAAGGAFAAPGVVLARNQAVAPPDPTETVRLSPAGAPGREGVSVVPIVPERSTDPSYRDRYAQYTTDPLMTVVRPARPNGSAMLLIPGGGYRWSVLDKEGFDVARVFAASGTTCFVLRYRLP